MEELQPQDIEELLQELEDDYDTAAAGVQRHLQAAYAHLRSEQFQNALHECDLIIQLDPTCYEAHNVRGLVLAQFGRKQEASGAFREALRLDPDFEAARTNLQEIEALPEDDVDVSVETQGRRFGIRAGAYIIDAVAYLVLTNITRYVVGFFLSAVLTLAGREFYLEERSLCLNLFVGLVLSALYFAIFEWLYGASLGKLVLGMCVVMESGERCTFRAALIRAGLRYVDGLFFGVPAYATMKPPLYQRIGDKSARTVVVDAKDPAIRQPRAGWWFLVAAVLYLALDGITSLLLLAPTLRLGGAMVAPELPAPIPVATFPPAVRTPPPPVLEAMRQLEPGWTSYMTGDELRENIESGAVLAGGFWADIAVASDGSLWFITLGGGVLHFDGEAWTPYTEDDGLASNIGLSSTAGRGPLGGTGDMQWFATAEGICRFDGETWTSYPESAYLASGPGPTALGPDGALWYGTAKGATRFDGEDWITYTTADGLAANYVLDMVVGPAGAMWFATNGGVSRFDGDRWTSFTIADGLAHNRVASVALAPDGALWFGTEGGVSRFDGETWTTYRTADGLISDDVTVVAAAGSVLWFGTRDGVSRFDGETWTSYTSADGLVHDAVSAMEVAPDGAVWFGTEGGLSRYLPQEASAAGEGASVLPPTAYAVATPVEEGNQVAVEHFRRGVDYQEQGQLGLAIEEFTHAIEVEPEFIEAYLLRGMTYIALGEPEKGIADLDRALPDLDRAVEQDPRLAEAYFNRGIAHFFMFDYDQAIADFDRAIELNPSYVEAYAVRGNAYDNNGEFDKAISSYGEALALDLEEGQHALLLFDRGQAYARHGDKDLAAADLEKALELGLPPVVAEQAEMILDSLRE